MIQLLNKIPRGIQAIYGGQIIGSNLEVASKQPPSNMLETA